MLVHYALFKSKHEYGFPEQMQKDFKKGYAEIGKLPGVLKADAHAADILTVNHFDFMVRLELEDEEALRKYVDSEPHTKLVAEYKDDLEDVRYFDYFQE